VEEVSHVVLARRALSHEFGPADEAHIVERLNDVKGIALPLMRVVADEHWNMRGARKLAWKLPCGVGVLRRTADGAIELIAHGTAPDGDNMRDAVHMSLDGERCEAHEGVRTSKLGTSTSVYKHLKRIECVGLRFRAQPIAEALTVASNVASCEGVVAELCWSNEPSNSVASRKLGLVRIPHLKPVGKAKERIGFIEQMDLTTVHLEPMLGNEIASMPECTPERALGR